MTLAEKIAKAIRENVQIECSSPAAKIASDTGGLRMVGDVKAAYAVIKVIEDHNRDA